MIMIDRGKNYRIGMKIVEFTISLYERERKGREKMILLESTLVGS